MIKRFLNNIKDGLDAAKNMLLEGNYKPFLIPLILLLALWFGLNHLNTRAAAKVSEVKRKAEAQKAEIKNEAAFLADKAAYEKSLNRLPPADRKNEWLLSEMITIFEGSKITPSKTTKHNLEESGIITMSSVGYEFETDFHSLGRLVEAIESNEHFLRISELTVIRTEGNLGRLKISLRVNTVFVNETPSNNPKGKRG